MRFTFAGILFFILFCNSYSQSDILEKAKFGMTNDELEIAFKDDGMMRFNKSEIYDDMRCALVIPEYMNDN